MPQPSRQTLSSGALGSTLAREMSATTVYSEKVLVPMKWNSCFPLQVKRDVLSGMKPRPWVSLWETRHTSDLWWPGAKLQPVYRQAEDCESRTHNLLSTRIHEQTHLLTRMRSLQGGRVGEVHNTFTLTLH